MVAMEVVGMQGDFEKKKKGRFNSCGQMAMTYGEPNTGMKLNLFRAGPGQLAEDLTNSSR